MPKVWIPRCGDGIRLTASWTASLTNEYRNRKMITAITGKDLLANGPRGTRAQPCCSVTLDAGTELVFDRVYIRQGADSYASVTFIVKDTADGKLVGERFWVTVDDANRIEAEPSSSKNPLSAFSLKSYVTAWRAKADPGVALQAANARTKRNELANVRAAIRDACCEPRSSQRRDARDPAIIAHVERIIRSLMPAALAERDAEHLLQLRAHKEQEAFLREVMPKGAAPRKPPPKPDDAYTRQQIVRHLQQVQQARRGYNAWSVSSQSRDADGSTKRTMLPLVSLPWKDNSEKLNIGFTVTTDADGNVTSIVPYGAAS